MKKRTPRRLGKLEKRLFAYTAAATAAGVSSLTLAQPAQAKIAYTPANIPIVVNGGFTELDLNHDGINDFKFNNYTRTDSLSMLLVAPAQNLNRIWAASCTAEGPLLCAAALPKGAAVGPHNPFQEGYTSLLMAGYRGGSIPTPYGRWFEARQAYVGLRFVIKGKTHFGWARIRMGGHSKPGFAATITGYAYETIPNKAIVAGKTKSEGKISGTEANSAGFDIPVPQLAGLGLLAQGASGVAVWRKRE